MLLSISNSAFGQEQNPIPPDSPTKSRLNKNTTESNSLTIRLIHVDEEKNTNKIIEPTSTDINNNKSVLPNQQPVKREDELWNKY